MSDEKAVLKLDARHTAIVVIDLQKGIVGRPGARIRRPPWWRTARACWLRPAPREHSQCSSMWRRARWLRPAAHHNRPGLEVDWPDAADWSELIPELDRQPGDVVILKRQWGAFYGTDLDLQLRRRGLTTIVLCGIATEFGVESTARDGYEHGYELIFAEDAMTGVTAESHLNSVERIFPRLGRVRPTDAIVAAFKA